MLDDTCNTYFRVLILFKLQDTHYLSKNKAYNITLILLIIHGVLYMEQTLIIDVNTNVYKFHGTEVQRPAKFHIIPTSFTSPSLLQQLAPLPTQLAVPPQLAVSPHFLAIQWTCRNRGV